MGFTFKIILIFAILGAGIAILTQPVFAITIGISTSKSCEASTTCPSIEQLAKQLDNTNQYYSGKFAIDEHGNFKRMPSQFKNHWLFYTHPIQPIIAVDPDALWIPRLDYYIVVEPSPFIYIDRTEKVKNFTRSEYHDRWVDSCSFSRVYHEHLIDTLNYLLSSCKETQHQTKYSIYMPPIPIDYENMKWYKYQKWLQESKEKCKEKC